MSEDRCKDKNTAKSSTVTQKGRFFSGVAVLTLSTVVVKLIGMLYKIPMMKYLGEEGMGYFNSAYEIYTLFYILATAGLPVAVSILVAENVERGRALAVKKIFSVSLLLFLILGLAGTAVLYFGAESFSGFIENSGALPSIVAISPMVLFICISSAVRGYFQGFQNMVPTALSQMIEAGGKLILGLSLAILAVKRGYGIPRAAAFATFGITVGTGISMLYLLLCKLLKRQKSTSDVTTIQDRSIKGLGVAKHIVKIAVPITLSSAVISLTRVVDLFMILRRLQAIGYSEAAANAVYGSYSTLAISMFNLPAAFVTPIALALVPVLTSAINGRDRYKEINTLNSSLRLTGLITLPASLGLSVFSRPILEFVFKGEDSAINTAAPLLSVLGLSVFFSCMMTVTNAVLQAYGKERLPLVSMLAGSAVKIVLSYVLIGIPQINVFGASISTFACSLTVAAMNFAYIKKCAPEVASPIKLFGGALGASAFSVAVGGGVYFLLAARIGRSSVLTLAAVGLTAIIFVISAVKTGAVSHDDILLLPKGEKIYGTLKKVKLIQK